MVTPDRNFRAIDPRVRIGHFRRCVSPSYRAQHMGKSGSSPPPAGSTGLFHAAILYPDRATLGDALRRLLANNIPPDVAIVHGVREALFLRNPDDNGLELYCDRLEAESPRNPAGSIAMFRRPFDLDALLRDTR